MSGQDRGTGDALGVPNKEKMTVFIQKVIYLKIRFLLTMGKSVIGFYAPRVNAFIIAFSKTSPDEWDIQESSESYSFKG